MDQIKKDIAAANKKSSKDIDNTYSKAAKNIDASTAKYANAERNDAQLNSLREGGKAIGGRGSGSSEDNVVMWFWIAILIHFLDCTNFGVAIFSSSAKGFPRPSPIFIMFYVAFIIFAFFLFMKDESNSNKGTFVFFVALAYFLPYSLQSDFIKGLITSSQNMLLLTGILSLLPVLPLYLYNKMPKNDGSRKLMTGYIIFLIIAAAFYVIVVYAPTQTTYSKGLAINPIAGIKYFFTEIVGKAFTGVGKSFTTAVQQAIASATGQPYEGQEESQVGIYVDNVKTLESRYSDTSDVIVTAKIKAKNVKEAVNVHLMCYIDGDNKGYIGSPNMTPSVLTEVVGDYENVVECRLGKMKQGGYTVKVQATFQFESTSDISYTFVSTDIKTDQYVQLGIDPQTIATYTGGPVELGLPSLTQPLRIDPKADATQASSYPFGVSLVNKWTQGKVVKGLNYTLNTPAEVKLVECSRTPVPSETREPDADGRNRHFFSGDATNAQEAFDAVRCRMKFTNIGDVLGSDLKSVKTFAAISNYQYSVEGSTYVLIEKS